MTQEQKDKANSLYNFYISVPLNLIRPNLRKAIDNIFMSLLIETVADRATLKLMNLESLINQLKKEIV